jgi:NAD(P)H-dependent flavin oxidoreductase YrpB (nitropropane dioxygenase family)
MTVLSTRFTRAFGVKHPIVSAPMAFAGGGALAAAVSAAGGLGLIGGGYGDPTWLDAQRSGHAPEPPHRQPGRDHRQQRAQGGEAAR